MLFAGPSGSEPDKDFESALAALQANGLGGFALLLRSLSSPRRGASHRLATLTPTERQILARLSSGQTSKSIALELGRSAGTIDTHVKAVLRKLGCKGRIEAARIAREHGLC